MWIAVALAELTLISAEMISGSLDLQYTQDNLSTLFKQAGTQLAVPKYLSVPLAPCWCFWVGFQLLKSLNKPVNKTKPISSGFDTRSSLLKVFPEVEQIFTPHQNETGKGLFMPLSCLANIWVRLGISFYICYRGCLQETDKTILQILSYLSLRIRNI